MHCAVTTARSRKCLGKGIFFIRLLFVINTFVDKIIELENNVHGNRAESRKRV
jgi:hypothetical protein